MGAGLNEFYPVIYLKIGIKVSNSIFRNIQSIYKVLISGAEPANTPVYGTFPQAI
jgi:hypothetical protein